MPCSSCTAPAAAARSFMTALSSPASSSAPGSPSTRLSTSSSCPTASAMGSRASRATACMRDFPHYGYRDMIEAQYRLLTEGLHVNHLRLVMGTSMGGMHTWLWGELHPDFMDALMPLASLPTQIAGRNRVWRKLVIDAIRNDPAWQRRRLHRAAAEPARRRRDAAASWAAIPCCARRGCRLSRRRSDYLDKTIAAS